MYDGLDDIFYPLIWFDTSTVVTDEDAADLRLVKALEVGVPAFGWSLIALGILLLLLGAYCGRVDWIRYKKAKHEKIIEQLNEKALSVSLVADPLQMPSAPVMTEKPSPMAANPAQSQMSGAQPDPTWIVPSVDQ